MECLPWHKKQWNDVGRRFSQGQLPHALLCKGPLGLGKLHFAKALAKSLFCEASQTSLQNCGTCRQCRLIEANTHPDFLHISPETEGRAIKVDDIRALASTILETTQCNDRRVVLIEPAEAMNIAASNALLKSLEEPNSRVMFILVTHIPDHLPATILSRCQFISFYPVSEENAAPWLLDNLAGADSQFMLGLAHGAPFEALALSKEGVLPARFDYLSALNTLAQNKIDPVLLAGQWKDRLNKRLLDWMIDWLMDALRYQMTGQAATIINKDFTEDLTEYAQKVSAILLLAMMKKVIDAKALLQLSQNVNGQLLLENLLIHWPTMRM